MAHMRGQGRFALRVWPCKRLAMRSVPRIPDDGLFCRSFNAYQHSNNVHCKYIYICTYICIYVYEYIYIYVCLYVHVYVYVFVYVYVYLNIHGRICPETLFRFKMHLCYPPLHPMRRYCTLKPKPPDTLNLTPTLHTRQHPHGEVDPKVPLGKIVRVPEGAEGQIHPCNTCPKRAFIPKRQALSP